MTCSLSSFLEVADAYLHLNSCSEEHCKGLKALMGSTVVSAGF